MLKSPGHGDITRAFVLTLTQGITLLISIARGIYHELFKYAR